MPKGITGIKIGNILGSISLEYEKINKIIFKILKSSYLAVSRLVFPPVLSSLQMYCRARSLKKSFIFINFKN